VNLYAYVGNNPVIYVDRMGTEKQLYKYVNNLSSQYLRTQILQQIAKIIPTANNIDKMIESEKMENIYLNEIEKIH
jgi:hypothetical protein